MGRCRRRHGRIYSGALGKLLLISLPPTTDGRTKGGTAIKIPCMTAAHAKRGPLSAAACNVMCYGTVRVERSNISAFYHFYTCRLSGFRELMWVFGPNDIIPGWPKRSLHCKR